MDLGGQMVKASDSWKEVVGSTPWSSGYASGHCVHKRLPLPGDECTRTMGTWYNDMHITKRSVSANSTTIGSMSVKQVYICMNDQGCYWIMDRLES